MNKNQYLQNIDKTSAELMDNTETALTFIQHICSSDIDAIENLLTGNFKMRGPLFKCNTRDDYIRSLRDDPPARSTFIVRKIKERRNSVEILYEYFKRGKFIYITQIFKFSGDKISKTVMKLKK